MSNFKILWADDEIDTLRPHILFLEKKGYEVVPVHTGAEAIEAIQDDFFDAVFLDEQMPGLSGLETMEAIKHRQPDLPIIMVTKSEEEGLMENALGSQIADYLIKPVNPSQLLLTLKKVLQQDFLISEQTRQRFLKAYPFLSRMTQSAHDPEQWLRLYRDLCEWEIKLKDLNDVGLHEVFDQLSDLANDQFSNYVAREYERWVQHPNTAPTLSHTLLSQRFFPFYQKTDEPTLLLVIDNFRYDQWVSIREMLEEWYSIERESLYYSILPTATPYSRNALFAGMLPVDIAKQYSDRWLYEQDEGLKNQHEEFFLRQQMMRHGLKPKFRFYRVISPHYLHRIPVDPFHQRRLSVMIYNFIDFLSHARTELRVMKELAPNEKAYCSLTKTWFKNSYLFEFLQRLSEAPYNVIITTDHGAIEVRRPARIESEKDVSHNLRYKAARSFKYNPKEVLFISHLEKYGLPRKYLGERWIIAKNDYYFVFPTDHQYYMNLYGNTIQHGGISLREVAIPYIHLRSRA